jgi:Protein of unknown function (DUF3592)
MDMNLSQPFINNAFKAKRQKFGITGLLITLLIGVVFTGAGSLFLFSTRADPSWTKVNGQVVRSATSVSKGSTLYSPIVSYTVDGQQYQVTRGYSSSSIPTIGEAKEIAYNPSQPSQAKVIESVGAMWWIWLFPVVGALLIVISVLSFVKSLNRSRKINKIISTGTKLQGVLTDIQSSSNNGYKIIVSATDSFGNVQNYESDPVNGAGGLAMADFRSSPIPIDVYVDPTNSKHYYVDISDIPNLTPERISELIKKAVSSTQPQSIVNTDHTAPADKSQNFVPKI